MKALATLYVAIYDEKVVAFGTNLSKFVASLSNVEPKARNRAYYDRKFKSYTWFQEEIDGKVYSFQEVYNKSAEQENASILSSANIQTEN